MQHAARSSRGASSRLGQPRRRPARDDQRLERPGRPERDDDEPLVVLLDDPLAARLLVGVVEQQAAPGARRGGAAGPRPRAPPRPGSAVPGPDLAVRDAGSRRPSPRPGSRRPGPSGSRRRARRSARPRRRSTRADVAGRHPRRASGRGAARSTRPGRSRARPRPAGARRRTPPIDVSGRSAAKSLVKTNVSVVGRVDVAVRPGVARTQVAVRVVGQAGRARRSAPRPRATAAGSARPTRGPTRRSAGCSADAARPPRRTGVRLASGRDQSARATRPARLRRRRVDDDRARGRTRPGSSARSGARPASVMRTSAWSSRAIELIPMTPHFEWSATTTRRRPASMSARSVSASSRFGQVKPERGSMPWTPTKTRSTWTRPQGGDRERADERVATASGRRRSG